MFLDIQEVKRLNSIDLTAAKGKRLYYSKIKAWISISFHLAYVIFSIAMMFYFHHSSKSLVVLILSVVVGFLGITDPISRLMLKNPVFILYDGKLYYIKENTWFDITKFKFTDEMVGRNNLSQTYCMFDYRERRIFAENNWHLEDPEPFKSNVHYQQLIKNREKRMT